MADTPAYDAYYVSPNNVQFYYGKSTYTKPTTGMPIGMEYRETDTGTTHTWDGVAWQPYSFGGGGGSSSTGTSVYWGSMQW